MQARAVAWLLAHGADARASCGADGVTPLHAASASGNPACVELLLKAAGAWRPQDTAKL